ncbi:unnamed protein product [Urochloa decumbens]|uniref:DUF1618 domain-containing protein n=1 Tax=Urochloa decumbens TaxID=240449 RepID=A0ABC9DYI6_9POAL
MRWVILNRIIRVDPGTADAAAAAPAQEQEQRAPAAGAPAAQGQHAAAAADFILRPILPPPRITVLSAGRAAHPDPENYDRYPYIIAAGSHGLLAHFSVHPFHGTQFTDYGLHESNLVVVRDFRDAGGGSGTAVAERVQRRSGRIPILSSIANVSFATDDRGGYQIAELQADRGRDLATVIYFRTTRLDGWYGKRMACPPEARDRERRPHGTVHADGNLWWFDLTWGILSCGMALADDGLWEAEYAVNLEEIWDDDSYKTTGLTRSVPLLVVVSLADPHLVYFALEERIFGVNVPQHRVVHGAAYEPLDMPWDETGPISGRYLAAWYLPPVPRPQR